MSTEQLRRQRQLFPFPVRIAGRIELRHAQCGALANDARREGREEVQAVVAGIAELNAQRIIRDCGDLTPEDHFQPC
jgi:hypothetical protein